MDYTFVELSGNPDDFFQILPVDWKNEITPIWKRYATKTQIFVLKDGDQIVAGGIVAHGMPLDMHHFFQEVMEWVDKGYRYIGYLWVIESRRNRRLGSLWLEALAKHDPKVNYWLTIEEEELKQFYLRNGFRTVKKIEKNGLTEWLMVKDRPGN
jgi:GNAT superfamily N-acetyltransferase